MFCGLTVPVLLNGVTTALELVAETKQFWNWPAVMIAGLTVTDAEPPELIVTADVTTKLRKRLVP